MPTTCSRRRVWDDRPPSVMSDLLCQLTELQASGGTVVTTNGCFDLLHVGHIRFLETARRLGDRLVVGLNSDASVRQLKGGSRPIVPQEARAAVLAGLRAVDDVVIFHDVLPVALLGRLKPDIHCKAADYASGALPEAATVQREGGRIEILPLVEDVSTTGLIERIVGAGNTPDPGESAMEKKGRTIRELCHDDHLPHQREKCAQPCRS